MKALAFGLTLSTVLAAGAAQAVEYKLQFTPNAGARGLHVAGYAFNGNTVTGDCSYYTEQSGSGRGGGYHTYKTYYNQTCTWDMYGNLQGIVSGAPVAPAPLSVNGTQTIYAQDASGDFTGIDTANGIGGFVNTLGSHYTWLTSSAYQVLQQQTYRFALHLKSDGDIPLNISATSVSSNAGKSTIVGGTCTGEIAVGKTCSVIVKYNPNRLCSASGLAYDTMTVSVTSNAGQANDFVQSYTIQLLPKNSGENCSIGGGGS